MKAFLGIISALIVFASPNAFAIETTQEMLSVCRPVARAEISGDYAEFPRNFGTGMCWGAFAMIQKVIVHVDENGQNLYSVCAPPNSRLIQLVAIFVNYAEKNPQRLHEDFHRVAFESLRMAFPCKERR